MPISPLPPDNPKGEPITLPPLPEKSRVLRDHLSYNTTIIEDEIDAYARAAIAADRERLAVAAPVANERAAFEAWIYKDRGDLTTFGTGANMHYRNSGVNHAWTAWDARARLAAPAPAAVQRRLGEYNLALGLLFGLHPEITRDEPSEVAQQIFDHVQAERADAKRQLASARQTIDELLKLRGTAPKLAELPNGWIFNHARLAADHDPEDGVWEIGYLNEDDFFSAILTVDTGNYFQPQDAEPLARAILARLPASPTRDAT